MQLMDTKERWVALLSPDEKWGKEIDEVIRAARKSRADALRYFAENHLDDLARFFKGELSKELEKWGG